MRETHAQGLDELAERFAQAGFRLYLVGGWVRDLLLSGRPDGDIDITTDALPDQTLALVQPWATAVWTQGKTFGTVGARRDGLTVEITTHRAEHYDHSSRKPRVRFSDDIRVDLSRRDFTINALAVELPNGALIDPFGGRADLERRVLRTPSEPVGLFTDDPLRIVRAGRFIAQLEVTPAPELIDAVVACRLRLAIVSRERICGELSRLLMLQQPSKGCAFLARVGVLDDLFARRGADRLGPSAGADGPSHVSDSGGSQAPSGEPPSTQTQEASRTAGTVGWATTAGAEPTPAAWTALDRVPAREALRWATLCRLMRIGSERAARVLKGLRCPHALADDAAATLKAADGLSALNGDVSAQRLLLIRHRGRLADAGEMLAALGDEPDAGEMERLRELAAREGEALARLPLDGHEVIEVIGAKGPAVGTALRWLHAEQLRRGPLTAEEARRSLLESDIARSLRDARRIAEDSKGERQRCGSDASAPTHDERSAQ